MSVRPLRLVQVGAGAMGVAWLRTIAAADGVELVGVADLDVGRAKAAVRSVFPDDPPVVAGSLGELLTAVEPDAVVNVTVPAAHSAVNIEALFAGLPVLCEKPAAPTLAEALVQAAASEAAGRLLMISQSRRYFAALTAFRERVAELGPPGLLTTGFYRAPHFGGFREEMPQPLLVDMAIHAFDASRHLLGAEPISVVCESWNPSWSWFQGDASATATFLFSNGTRYVFTGSWCAEGRDTSWNGEWRAVAAGGTATWDGESRVTSSLREVEEDVMPGAHEQIAGALAEFVEAVRTGSRPDGAIRGNLGSLAMVEAAVRSAETGDRVNVGALMERAHEEALALPMRDEVRERLKSWGAVATILS
ncbi:Gfo/Idh/MocA family protein [Nonomuraea sp. PA05]|uniref:Gfo/Idh/MocA family protein n=1 Tax=Nonomuraea sp. PA05 TaxID=2604466 RepID=UPI001CA346ED|nr:Gfo/Idh/MocA family oxidoreductase [Nonomuraea sp. PA05]